MTAPIGNTETRIRPGHYGVAESRSPSQSFMTVFEDDGETGYVYALDLGREHGQKIVDALQIYVAKEEFGDVEESVVRILWSSDGNKSGVELDGELQAVFDFGERIGCSLSGFPPTGGGWRRVAARSVGKIAEFFAGKAV
jgi:hypothetical protein